VKRETTQDATARADPYRAPQATAEPAAAAAPVALRLVPLRRRTLALQAAVALTLTATTAALALDLVLLFGTRPEESPASHPLANVHEIALTLRTALLLASAVAGCVWIHRATQRAHLLERYWRSTPPVWAVACWFVPIANLIVPFQVVRDVWRFSRGQRGSLDSSERTLLLSWWCFWLGAGLASVVADAFPQQDPSHLNADALYCASLLVSGALFFGIVGRIARDQRQHLGVP
jgi:hypothetical protein